MRISTKGRYAIEAIVDLSIHSKEELESLKNVSERLNISKNYLEQIFVDLKKNDIVDSVRGPHGGYRLSRPAEDTTAKEVIEAVEGEIVPVACIEKNEEKECTNFNKCVSKNLWITLMNEINSVMDSITVADLANEYMKTMSNNHIEYYI